MEKTHKEILIEEQKRNEQKINIYKDNENRFKSRIHHLEHEVSEINEKLENSLTDLEETRSELEKFREAEVSHVTSRDLSQYEKGVEVTHVITEEITETVQRRIPQKLVTSHSFYSSKRFSLARSS